MLSFLTRHPPRTRVAHLQRILFDEGRSLIEFKPSSDRYLVINRLPPTQQSSADDNEPCPPNCALAPPVHWHSAQDETFHVLEGQARFFVNGQAHTATPGEVVHIPQQVYHTFRNASESQDLLIEFMLEPQSRKRDEAFFSRPPLDCHM